MSPIGVIQTWPVAWARMTTFCSVRNTFGWLGGNAMVWVTVDVAGSTTSSLLSVLSTSRTVLSFCRTSTSVPVLETTAFSS